MTADLRRIYDRTATSRTAPNVPGCSCVWEDDEDDDSEEPVFCPMHERMLGGLRWSTLAMMVIDYGAVIHATERALPDLLAVVDAAREVCDPMVGGGGGDRWWDAHAALRAALDKLDAGSPA